MKYISTIVCIASVLICLFCTLVMQRPRELKEGMPTGQQIAECMQRCEGCGVIDAVNAYLVRVVGETGTEVWCADCYKQTKGSSGSPTKTTWLAGGIVVSTSETTRTLYPRMRVGLRDDGLLGWRAVGGGLAQ